MDPQLKQRVVGAAVLVAVGVVFIPIFLDETGDDQQPALPIGTETAPPSDFNSRVVPLDDETMTQVERAMDLSPEELAQSQDWGDKTAVSPESTPTPDESTRTAAVPIDAPRTGVTAWVVQLGSFDVEKNAMGLVERLKQDGYTAFIEPLRDDAKVLYRVRVGPELTKLVAEQIRDKLAQDVDIKGLVMRYP
jgi:DedD protein